MVQKLTESLLVASVKTKIWPVRQFFNGLSDLYKMTFFLIGLFEVLYLVCCKEDLAST